MNTGEDIQALRKIADTSRLIAIVMLAIHLYQVGYEHFHAWGISSQLTDRILNGSLCRGLLSNFLKVKIITMAFLTASLIGNQGKREQGFNPNWAALQMILGLAGYFGSNLWLLPCSPGKTIFLFYASASIIGMLLTIRGFAQWSRVLWQRLGQTDIFNLENQTFPQQQEYIQNEYSVNLPYTFRLLGKLQRGWINITNPFRAILVLGNPGSGKSYFIIRHVISQHIAKGFTMFVYDFKYDDLTRIAYHHWSKNKRKKGMPTQFYRIDFEDLQRTHRCNPLEPSAMSDITDAAESARTILLGLNRDWIKKQGEFFIESAINLLTAVIWYLRCHQDGLYCTLPHVIELMQQDYDRLFSLLRSQKEIEVLVNPFINAYLNNAMEQLEGQVASTKIALARLSSPSLYFVLSGNDFSLDINNPKNPKIVCMGNNPQKIQTYGAVLSLFVNRLVKQVNRKDMEKCSLIFDEFPTIYLNNIDSLIATARSNRVSTCLCVQDISQLRTDYGKDHADVIMNIVGNLISGQVSGDTARQLAERFGKIMQARTSISINSSDTSTSHSHQLESAIPPSTISSLSSGDFVGMVADDPHRPVQLKTFHGRIRNDHDRIAKEQDSYVQPETIRNVNKSSVQRNFLQIKDDIEQLTFSEMDRLLSDPTLRHLVVQKK